MAEPHYDDLAAQIRNLAAIMSETNTTVVRMEEKLSHFQSLTDMKVEQERSRREQDINNLHRDIAELRDFRTQHETEHKQAAKEKHQYLIGVIVSVALSVGSALVKLFL